MKQAWNLPKIEYIALKDYEERRSVGLIYSSAAWNALKETLNLPVV